MNKTVKSREGTIWTTLDSGLSVPSGRDLQIRDEHKESFAEIKQMAIRTRELYSNMRISLNPASSLNQLIIEVSQIADSWLKGQSEPDPMGALLKVSNAYRICSAIDAIRNEPGISVHLKKLGSGDLNLLSRNQSSAKDYLFELELYLVLKGKGLSPKFEEPDISISLAGERVSVACKKIYSEKRLQDSLSRAVAQIQKSKRHGLVAINLDDLHPDQSILQAMDSDGILDSLNSFNTEFIRRHEERFRKYMESSRIFACLISSSLIGDSLRGSLRINNHRQDTLWVIPKLGSERQRLSDSLYNKINVNTRA